MLEKAGLVTIAMRGRERAYRLETERCARRPGVARPVRVSWAGHRGLGPPSGGQEYRAVRVCQLVVPFGFLLPTDHSVTEPVVTRPSKLSMEFPLRLGAA